MSDDQRPICLIETVVTACDDGQTQDQNPVDEVVGVRGDAVALGKHQERRTGFARDWHGRIPQHRDWRDGNRQACQHLPQEALAD